MNTISVEKALVSNRYENDGKPIRSLTAYQKSIIDKFLTDIEITQFEINECAVCGGRVFLLIAEKDQFGIPLSTGICKKCGLIQSLSQLDESSTVRFYSEYYRKIYEGVPKPSLDHGFYKALYSGKMVPSLPRNLSKKSTILEIGCGGGWNLMPFHKEKFKYYGFDYDKHMISHGRNEFGLNIFQGGIDEANKSEIKADYLILSHVLEHTSNPIVFLRQLGGLMHEGGLLRLTVPSINYLKYFGGSGTSYDFGMVLQNAHNFTFSENSLRNVLQIAGFKPLILIGGFCLAKYSKPENPPEINISVDYHSVRKLIIDSEKAVSVKDRIYRLSPAILRRFFPYINYIFSPAQLFKLFMFKYNRAN